ncbi:MAG TPA: hypothetical protein VG318_04980 [Actinomycetota bacterium]|nr:hypothetical protein [Actinomycetota bacterium]
MKLFDLRRGIAVALAAGVLAAPVTPASAVTFANPADYDTAVAASGANVATTTCAAVATDEGTRYRIAVTGTAAASGAVATRASCSIVQEGRVVARLTSALPGSSAVIAGVVYVARKPWSVCAGIYALYPDGTAASAENC